MGLNFSLIVFNVTDICGIFNVLVRAVGKFWILCLGPSVVCQNFLLLLAPFDWTSRLSFYLILCTCNNRLGEKWIFFYVLCSSWIVDEFFCIEFPCRSFLFRVIIKFNIICIYNFKYTPNSMKLFSMTSFKIILFKIKLRFFCGKRDYAICVRAFYF